MSNPKKVLHIRSKDNKHNAGSVSLEGKQAPQATRQSLNKVLQNSLFKSYSEYHNATQEIEEKYEVSVKSAKKIFAESLPSEANIAYLKYDGWRGFDLDECIEPQDYESYSELKSLLNQTIVNAKKERELVLSPFLAKRDKQIVEAKKNHPKKWWQSYSSYLGDICGTCGNKIVDYCPTCNPNA